MGAGEANASRLAMGDPPSTLARVRLSLRPRGSPEASRTLLHPHLCACPALRPGPGPPELLHSHISWSPLGGAARNGAPGAPTLRTASPALIHAHPQAVPGSSTPTPGHSPHAYCLAKSLICPQVPSGSQGPHGGPPSSSWPPGVHRGPEAPGVGGNLPAQAPQLPRIQAGFAPRPSGSR